MSIPQVGYAQLSSKSVSTPTGQKTKAPTKTAAQQRGFFQYGGQWFYQHAPGSVALAGHAPGQHEVRISAPGGFTGRHVLGSNPYKAVNPTPTAPAQQPPAAQQPANHPLTDTDYWAAQVTGDPRYKQGLNDQSHQYLLDTAQQQGQYDALATLNQYNAALAARQEKLRQENEQSMANLAAHGVLQSGGSQVARNQLYDSANQDIAQYDREFGPEQVSQLKIQLDARKQAYDSALQSLYDQVLGNKRTEEAPAGGGDPNPAHAAAPTPDSKTYLAGLYRNALGAAQFRNAKGTVGSAEITKAANNAINQAWTVARKSGHATFTIPGYGGTYYMNKSGSIERVS